MIDSNIRFLRKQTKMTQEQLAEKLGVTRQSVAKWENGETLPDVMNCVELADIFDTTVELLVSAEIESIRDTGSAQGGKENGKFIFGIVKVGERGQVVIPKSAREVFEINPGDRLAVLGDKSKGGIAFAKIFGNNGIFSLK